MQALLHRPYDGPHTSARRSTGNPPVDRRTSAPPGALEAARGTPGGGEGGEGGSGGHVI